MTSEVEKTILSAVRCADYTPDRLEAALTKLLAPFGGLENIVESGQTVFLKVNLLTNRPPEKAATTHPALVEILTRRIIDRGARVFIGDSPPMALGRIAAYWDTCGLKSIADRTGATLVALEQEPTRPLSIKGPGGTLAVHVSEWAFKADVLFNLPKLKTHNLTVLTGAVKNFFGLLPGLQKARLHKDFPLPDDLSDMIVGLAEGIKRISPRSFTIMDGILGMDGNGPAGGQPVETRVLLASPDPVAVDLGMCAIVGVSPDRVPTLVKAKKRGFGPHDLSTLQHMGDPLETLRCETFRLGTTPRIPSFPKSIFAFAQRLIWAFPRIDPTACIRCNACVKICPAEAMIAAPNRIGFRRNRCISCFCCAEVCPKDAIEIAISPLLALAKNARRVVRFLQGK
ncbi:MAG: DUF362 domain-containing protein [Candidatus Ozemobacteraceae bacterium]